ncbi:MAG TPA: hypothetical protein VHD91_04205 [Gaiellaceae bacterium]|nr:hypothetical protein [Gaiellaceae bacterium]
MLLASVTAGTVIGILISAFVTGALARFAVPGPDPMPAWLTILIGLAGSVIGGGIAYAAGLRDAYEISTGGFLAAIVLVILYRRFVQRRPLVGPEAYRFPKRGVGVQTYRDRLHKAGIDPDRIGTPVAQGPLVGPPRPARPDHPGAPDENPAHYLGLLEELHDAGVLDDEEYQASRTRLLERLR